MAGFFLYASFPNTRNKNRPATQRAVNYHVTVNNQDEVPLVMVAAADENRTYILVENLSDEVTAAYIYATTQNIDPSVIPVFGLVDDLLYNPTTDVLYQKQDTGLNTNWVITTIDLVGTQILPLQTASLESPQDIYVAALQIGGAHIAVAIDAGRG